jgi:hypothetical protein
MNSNKPDQKLERVVRFHAEKDHVFNRLYEMSSFERIRLVDRYTKRAEGVFHRFPEDQLYDIIAKLLKIKFSKKALIDFFLSGDPVVDSPDCRLEDFLISELVD